MCMPSNNLKQVARMPRLIQPDSAWEGPVSTTQGSWAEILFSSSVFAAVEFEVSDARDLLWLHSETILLLSCGAAPEIGFL